MNGVSNYRSRRTNQVIYTIELELYIKDNNNFFVQIKDKY
jgi:hypothetical protein